MSVETTLWSDTARLLDLQVVNGDRVSDDQVQGVPLGVSRDLDMRLQGQTLKHGQELCCRTTGGIVHMDIYVTNDHYVG